MVLEITTSRLRLPMTVLIVKVANSLRLPTDLALKWLRLPYTYIGNNNNNKVLRLPNSVWGESGNVNIVGQKMTVKQKVATGERRGN